MLPLFLLFTGLALKLLHNDSWLQNSLACPILSKQHPALNFPPIDTLIGCSIGPTRSLVFAVVCMHDSAIHSDVDGDPVVDVRTTTMAAGSHLTRLLRGRPHSVLRPRVVAVARVLAGRACWRWRGRDYVLDCHTIFRLILLCMCILRGCRFDRRRLGLLIKEVWVKSGYRYSSPSEGDEGGIEVEM